MIIPHLQLDDKTQLTDEHIRQLICAVFRQDLNEAGAADISFKNLKDSFQLRALMVKLKEQLSAWFQRQTASRLHYYSMGRFDQKKTTRLHLDGGPVCSFLMLGYEPSPVTSQFLIADFSRCVAQEGLSPQTFLEPTSSGTIYRDHSGLGMILPPGLCSSITAHNPLTSPTLFLPWESCTEQIF